MRTVSLRLTDLIKTVIPIGFVGENLHTKVFIDCKIAFDEYPTANVAMTVKPPKGDAYPAVVSRNGDIVTWDVSDSDLLYEGNGEIQLAFVVDEVIAKSYIGRTRIQRSIIPTGEIPTPIEDWITKADEILDSIPGQIDSALEEAKESGEFDGEDGFSPEVSVEEITGGHQVSITDAEGTSTFDVMDGAPGDPGAPGAPGPGVSRGGTTGQVLKKKSNADYDTEWAEEAGGVQIDDSAGIGDTDVTWSANKSAMELSKKYVKPSGGIPASDIANGVIPDVQINGTSIVNNGVANVPVADADTLGTVKVRKADGYYGVGMTSGGILTTSPATDAQVATGTESYKPLNPKRQHIATFFGLSKVAGVDLANETVDLGTYPASSKTAIQGMLGVTDAISAVDDQVIISDTQPSATSNKLWIDDSSGTEVSVPTYAEMITGLAGKVSDVQINGTSIVNDGVARVPIASWNTYGVGKTDGVNYGVGQASGFLVISPADESSLKTGTHIRRPVVANNQHISTFYGLAKAAGADMASLSSTTVGQYPDAQKIAIQKMLGIYEPPYVLLNDVTLQTESCIELTTDSDGTPYNLRSVYVEISYPENLTTASDGYGRYRFFDLGNNYLVAETGKYTNYQYSSYKHIHLIRYSNLTTVMFATRSGSGSNAAWQTKRYSGSGGGATIDLGNIVKIKMYDSDVEPASTNIKVWGQWAY